VRRRCAVLVAGLLGLSTLAAPAAADTPDPSPWPQTPGVDPGIDTSAHSLRIAGADRGQTALSASLLLRGRGSYPFGTSDRTSGAGVDLTAADRWWGLGTCPYSVIVTAGDAAADSLTAASLSDPTDRSSEPQLVRSATSDAVLAPVGRTSRVDTDSAPIVVTTSARQGATTLSPAARQSIIDLADGGCETVRTAIVVGGTGAVPSGVEPQLIGLGLDQVFRVSGTDRFGTAAAIALALGTGASVPSSTTCVDDDVADGTARMGWYANAAVELRLGPQDCQVLGRTVVLTDGLTGADALAAGWWTSTWQVPTLLVDGAGELPPATRSAMESLVIDNVVVLGGLGRVPASTAAEVAEVTGADVHRIAGADRYETSVRMAEAFGGWFPTFDGTDHDGSMVCLASSSGSGGGSVGWPDALGAGPWCAEAGGLATASPAPARGLPPVSGPNPRTTRAARPSHDAVPVLLTPVGATQLALPAAGLLASTFDPADVWCSSLQPSSACLDPGFVVAFGGTAVLSEPALRQAARAVSGETYVVFDDQLPFSEGGFWTELDLSPVYAEAGADPAATAGRTCVDRDTLTGVRWLSAYADLETSTFLAEHDLLTGARYRDGANVPACVGHPSTPTGLLNVLGTSISGRTTTVATFDLGPDRRFALSAPIVHDAPLLAEGADSAADDGGATTTLVFSTDDVGGVAATSRGTTDQVTSATIRIDLTRGLVPSDPSRFTASVSLVTPLGTVSATAVGEAVLVDGTWLLRSGTTLGEGTWTATRGAGGFRAELATGEEGPEDDRLTWRFDAVLAPPAS